jgi:hypothetical protein
MAAGNYDLQITQGKTYDVPFAYKTGAGVAIPLTGYTLRMQIRASYDASTYFLELTTANGRLPLNAAAGTWQILLSASVTAELPYGEHVYDLEAYNSSTGHVIELLRGKCRVLPEVTR